MKWKRNFRVPLEPGVYLGLVLCDLRGRAVDHEMRLPLGSRTYGVKRIDS